MSRYFSLVVVVVVLHVFVFAKVQPQLYNVFICISTLSYRSYRLNALVRITLVSYWRASMKMNICQSIIQQDNLDVFSFPMPCMYVCNITLISDGSGNSPDWNVQFVDLKVRLGPFDEYARTADFDALLSPWSSLSASKRFCGSENKNPIQIN